MFLAKGAVEGKVVEKTGSTWNHRILRFHRPCGEIPRFIHSRKKQAVFHTKVFLFPQKKWKNVSYRLELILVLISFTVSAKEGSFFIFFSTC